jgi:hypothetical protein
MYMTALKLFVIHLCQIFHVSYVTNIINHDIAFFIYFYLGITANYWSTP